MLYKFGAAVSVDMHCASDPTCILYVFNISGILPDKTDVFDLLTQYFAKDAASKNFSTKLYTRPACYSLGKIIS